MAQITSLNICIAVRLGSLTYHQCIYRGFPNPLFGCYMVCVTWYVLYVSEFPRNILFYNFSLYFRFVVREFYIIGMGFSSITFYEIT